MSSKINSRSPVSEPGPTGRRPWSTWLLREWAALRYPGVHLYEQVRLGPTPVSLSGVTVSPELERMLKLENWYADGILVLTDQVLIIEAKVQATPGAISQVKFYWRQALRTADLANLIGMNWTPVVLWAEDDADVSNFARGEGVRVEIYTPPWIADYLQLVQFRNRIPAPQQVTGEPV